MKKKLLIIGSVWPEPASSAAGTRMMQLISFFGRNNFEITFATTAQKSGFEENLEPFDVRERSIQLNDSSFDDFVTELSPEIVLFDRFAVEEQFGWRVLKNCPNALKILNTEDLHSLRYSRQKAVKENRNFELDDLFSDEITKREIASIFRSDLTLMVSKYEMDLLRNSFKIEESQILYLPVFSENTSAENISSEKLSFEKRNGFMFIGNFLHEPNYDAVLQIKNFIWPILKKDMPSAEMYVYGAYPSQKVLQLHNAKEKFFVEGRAENVADVMNKHRVLLAPIRFGAGIKGKFIDAMQFGLPTVTTSIGAEAMSEKIWNGFVADDAEEIARKSVLLHDDIIEWHKAQANGFELLQQFDRNNFEDDFLLKINQTIDNLAKHRNKNFIGSMLNFHTMRSTEFMSRWIEEKNKK